MIRTRNKAPVHDFDEPGVICCFHEKVQAEILIRTATVVGDSCYVLVSCVHSSPEKLACTFETALRLNNEDPVAMHLEFGIHIRNYFQARLLRMAVEHWNAFVARKL